MRITLQRNSPFAAILGATQMSTQPDSNSLKQAVRIPTNKQGDFMFKGSYCGYYIDNVEININCGITVYKGVSGAQHHHKDYLQP